MLPSDKAHLHFSWQQRQMASWLSAVMPQNGRNQCLQYALLPYCFTDRAIIWRFHNGTNIKRLYIIFTHNKFAWCVLVMLAPGKWCEWRSLSGDTSRQRTVLCTTCIIQVVFGASLACLYMAMETNAHVEPSGSLLTCEPVPGRDGSFLHTSIRSLFLPIFAVIYEMAFFTLT